MNVGPLLNPHFFCRKYGWICLRNLSTSVVLCNFWYITIYWRYSEQTNEYIIPNHITLYDAPKAVINRSLFLLFHIDHSFRYFRLTSFWHRYLVYVQLLITLSLLFSLCTNPFSLFFILDGSIYCVAGRLGSAPLLGRISMSRATCWSYALFALGQSRAPYQCQISRGVLTRALCIKQVWASLKPASSNRESKVFHRLLLTIVFRSCYRRF